MGNPHTYIQAALPPGAHRVQLADGTVIAPRIIVAPELPLGALRVTVGSVTLVPDTRLVRPGGGR